jgi:hypothetical protein
MPCCVKNGKLTKLKLFRERPGRRSVWAVVVMLAFALSACHYERDDETVTPNSPPPATHGDINPRDVPSFYVDRVNGEPYRAGVAVPVKENSGEIIVKGWAVDLKNKKPLAAMFIIIDDQAQFPASYGEERLDVGAFFKEDGLIDTGFTGRVPRTGLTRGKHFLSFKAVCSDRTYLVSEWRIELSLQ